MGKRLIAALAAVTMLGVSGCGGHDDAGPAHDKTPADSPGATESETSSVVSQAPGVDSSGIALSPAAKYDPYPDAPRSLTLLEKSLLREPGTFAGDDFDLDAAVRAAKATNPGSVDQWREAILAQTHGSYAEDAKALIDFKAIIDAPATPARKLQGVDVVGQNHYAIVLDASGSMADRSGGRTRMDQAKRAIRAFTKRLPANSSVSLRIYGYKGSNSGADKTVSCGSSRVVYNGKPGGIPSALAGVRPVGWTPLARGIGQVAGDVPKSTSDAIVYVVTDGIETCGGDPVGAARRVARTGVKPIVNVVGFQVGNGDAARLRRVAKAGNGRYFGARSGAALTRYWREDTDAMKAAWVTWRHRALASISRQGHANMERAEAPGKRIMEGIGTEWSHQKQMIAALKDDGALDPQVSSQVFRQLFTRQGAIFRWAFAEKSGNFSNAFAQQSKSWRAAYQLGSSKWTEYYRKSTHR